ncbi:MAG: hypothetical protein A3F84_17525 [Candidatus Handelsmanbacteria bacterium RIFCSPLOWO2_12_FULL_64_10]|uniref:Tetratricopeptide repeat protein n=1 Tax=Handelsmanbacteria sp. (strain RIFCSPLOWO2_12_FULL_64_10) TaxID=1817868 RepID=A0A1F6CZ13_HANXR|nr:MAG: hypothetical protein A3F84_17525 [Candidatus Handelsmanbacteria bacterium RIFCSPLOWO2_12_FULL_64_10]
MFQIKTLSKEAIPKALERVERYRLLNEPAVAVSICQDILQVEPGHQQALVMLILALTDQFSQNASVGMNQVLELVPRLQGDYERAYYTGIIHERQARARLNRSYPGSEFDAHDLLREAMTWFEKAETLRAAGDEDAVLRWNTCARIVMERNLKPRPRDDSRPSLE